MSKLRVLVTNNGTHPASKWADFAANDIIQITAQTPTTLMREALDFRGKLVGMLTKHHQTVIDDEKTLAQNGKVAAPKYAQQHVTTVVNEICDLVRGLSFERHFDQDHVRRHLADVCHRYFQTTRMVERQAYENEARAPKKKTKN